MSPPFFVSGSFLLHPSAWVIYSPLVPTVLVIDGVRFVVYPNDHRPPHIHVVGPGWQVIVVLGSGEWREAQCTARQASWARRHVMLHEAPLRAAWESLHGEV